MDVDFGEELLDSDFATVNIRKDPATKRITAILGAFKVSLNGPGTSDSTNILFMLLSFTVDPFIAIIRSPISRIPQL